MLVFLLVVGSCAGHKYSAVIALRSMDDGLKVSAGAVSKWPEPILSQDKPWEPRLDNGYPNVLYDDDGTWKLWYGDCIGDDGSCKSQIVLYAESDDGFSWSKPDLGVFDLDSLRPDLDVGTHNNIVLQGGGVGVYKHQDRYIAFGDFCALDDDDDDDDEEEELLQNRRRLIPVEETSAETAEDRRKGRGDVATSVALPSCPSGSSKANVATSDDGIRFRGGFRLDWDDPQTWDTHNNLIYDDDVFVATTRLKIDGLRNVGVATSTTSDVTSFDEHVEPALTLKAPSDTEQNYAQITFKWLDAYLGINMMFDDDEPSDFGKGKVHCRLAWSASLQSGWHLLDKDDDFIPLGHQGSSVDDPANAFDSHICFAAALPTTVGDLERLYYMGGNGPHNGDRNSSLGLATLRKDGWLAVTGTGTYETNDLKVDRTLRVTADVFSDGGYLRLLAVHGHDLDDPPSVTANVTDAALDVDLTDWIDDDNVSFRFELKDAALYTISFDDDDDDESAHFALPVLASE